MPLGLVYQYLCKYLPQPVSSVTWSSAGCLVLGYGEQLHKADDSSGNVWEGDIDVNEHPSLNCVH